MNSWITIVGIIIVAALIYFIFFAGEPSASDQNLLQVGAAAEPVGQRVLSLLNQIQSLRIDDSFFSDPVYGSLQDYSVAIPQLPVGRDNPFAPI